MRVNLTDSSTTQGHKSPLFLGRRKTVKMALHLFGIKGEKSLWHAMAQLTHFSTPFFNLIFGLNQLVLIELRQLKREKSTRYYNNIYIPLFSCPNV